MDYATAQYLINAIAIFTYLLAVYHILQFLKVPLPTRYTIVNRIKKQNLKIQSNLVTQDLEMQFAAAGYPLQMNAKRFQLYRFSIGYGLLIIAVYLYFRESETSIVLRIIWILIPILIMFQLLNPKRKFMRNVLDSFREHTEYLKNQELFMLLSMMLDEQRASQAKSIDVISSLNELRQYTPRIAGSITKGVRKQAMGIDTVMQTIGEDVGTDEAIEVCKIIASLETTQSDSIYDQLSSREEMFVATLRANRVKRRTKTTNRVNILVWLPLPIYGLNVFFIIGRMLTDMAGNLTKLS